MTRSDAIRQALDASRDNPCVRWYAVATPRDPETYVVTTSLCPGDIIAAVAKRGTLLPETTVTPRRVRRPQQRARPFCYVCERRVEPPLEQHLAACHCPTCGRSVDPQDMEAHRAEHVQPRTPHDRRTKWAIDHPYQGGAWSRR